MHCRRGRWRWTVFSVRPYAMHHVAALQMMSETSDLGRAVGDGDGRWFATQGHANGRSPMRDVSGEEIAPDYQGAFRPAVFLYDNHPGGIGLSSLCTRDRPRWCGALELVERCDCRYGCPSCVGPVLASDEEGAIRRARSQRPCWGCLPLPRTRLQVGMNLAGRLDRLRGRPAEVTPTRWRASCSGWMADARRRRRHHRASTLARACGCRSAVTHCCCASANYAMPRAQHPLDLTMLPGARSGRSRLVYLDTETTGLSGGVGNLTFMVGVARYTDAQTLAVRQYLLGSFAAEAAILRDLVSWVGRDAVLVSYNGRCFDLPLLGARCAMQRCGGWPGWTAASRSDVHGAPRLSASLARLSPADGGEASARFAPGR